VIRSDSQAAVKISHLQAEPLSCAEIAGPTGLSERQVERHIARAIIAIDRSLNGPPLRWWERLLGW
jgi:hypothetical protein